MKHRSPAIGPGTITADTGYALILLSPRTGRVRALPGGTGESRRVNVGTAAPVQVAAALPSWGTAEVPACLTVIAAPRFVWALRAAAAVLATITVRSAGARRHAFARMIRLAEAATRPGTAASADEAEAALRAVRWTAQFVPARMACLEESVAAAVTLALAARHADWRQGIARDPVRMHAWIEERGRAVGEPAATSCYTPLIRMPASAGGQEAPHE
jgi:hypothetical protein